MCRLGRALRSGDEDEGRGDERGGGGGEEETRRWDCESAAFTNFAIKAKYAMRNNNWI